MKLLTFQIQNFRSINDSGSIDASRITALLGRNESGKSNLLRALQSLNPPEGFRPLKPVKDFPRHRRLEECTDATPVVTSTWELDDKDRVEFGEIFSQATSMTKIRIGRHYGGTSPWVALDGLKAPSLDTVKVKSSAKRIAAGIRAKAEKVEDEAARAKLKATANNIEAGLVAKTVPKEWADHSAPIFQKARTALASVDVNLTESQENALVELENMGEEIVSFDTSQRELRTHILKILPVFIFLDEYPELDGHQNIAEFIERKNRNQPSPADPYFEKLCKVAGLKPKELEQHLRQGDQETRNQLANRASSVITQEIRRLWKDRQLKIRFNLDASHFDTYVSDPNATFDVEVNLNERSRGFKWFLSFYITFAADTVGGDAENAILLLDEPGLYLHAKSQSDLLQHFEKDFANQIIYTTHSPFMVPTHNLDAVRTVNIAEEKGTSVTNDPSGDSRTLFPLQAALGYDLSQSLFVGGNNLVVEGVTDFWILSSISEYLRDAGKLALHQDLTITPAGGAQKVSFMVTLLTSESMNVLVLLDDERDARSTKDDLVKSKLIGKENVVFVSEWDSTNAVESDIEDLLDEDVYNGLIQESFDKELKGRTLPLNPKIPRIAKRYEQALKDIGIPFFKTRPARLLLRKMAEKPEGIVSADTEKRFVELFRIINSRFEKLVNGERGPFT